MFFTQSEYCKLAYFYCYTVAICKLSYLHCQSVHLFFSFHPILLLLCTMCLCTSRICSNLLYSLCIVVSSFSISFLFIYTQYFLCLFICALYGEDVGSLMVREVALWSEGCRFESYTYLSLHLNPEVPFIKARTVVPHCSRDRNQYPVNNC